MEDRELVLVTGGTGFVGGHMVQRALDAGYRVRTTVRSLDRPVDERAEPVVADLMDDAGWADAVAGCDYVLHVASPFTSGPPESIIRPAREGTLRVLRHAHAAGVRRVVMTSSFAAVGYSGPDKRFDEHDWTDPETAGLTAYVRSKTLAEGDAWRFARESGLDLAVINPVGIFGPALTPRLSGSVQIIKSMLDGSMRDVPRFYTNVVDVRDVADLHLAAMTSPLASGERFLALSGEPISFPEIARLLRHHLGAAVPDLPVRAGTVAADLGQVRRADNTKARKTFDWTPRTTEEALLASARSLLVQ